MNMVYYPPGVLKPDISSISRLFNPGGRCKGCGRQVRITPHCTGMDKHGNIGFRLLCAACAKREGYV